MFARTPLFHVGFPKAGSTTLQQQIFRHLTDVAYFGLSQDLDPDLKELYLQLFKRDGINFDLERARSLVGETSIKAGNALALFSDEAGLGLTISYPDVAAKAERLLKVFGTDLKVLISVREQAAILTSLYRDHPFEPRNITMGKPVTFANWMAAMEKMRYFRFTDLLHYDHVVQFYEDIFGPKNVLVLPLELMAGDRTKYATMLGNFIGVAPQEIFSRLGQKPANIGHSAGVNRLRRLRRHIPSSIHLSRVLPKTLENTLIQFLKRGSRDEVVITPELRKKISDRYAEPNQRLAMKTGLDLSALGYSVPEMTK